MTPAELKAARERLDLSQHDLATHLGLTGKHRRLEVSRWERGVNPVPEIRALKLRMLLIKHERTTQ